MAKKIALIVLLGGIGNRFGCSIPKQFLLIHGTPLYQLTLRNLTKYHFDEIILPTHSDWIDTVQKACSHFPHLKVIPGGATRQESSFRAVMACSDSIDYVMIHDGVRPFISEEILQHHFDALNDYDAVDTCCPSSDTIVKSHDGNIIDSIPNRSLYYQGQTPQSFRLSLIREAHKQAQKNPALSATDDCSLIPSHIPIKIVPGNATNLKITSPIDQQLAYYLWNQQPLPHPLDNSFQHKTFIIAGGFGDIGQAIVKSITDNQGHVIYAKRSHLETAETAKTFFQKAGKIDGLINCMGTLIVKPLHHLKEDEMDQLLHDNLKAVMLSCKFALIKTGGHILNIASTAALHGRANYAIYSSCKAAVVNFTEALAQERPNQYINVLSPSRTATTMRRKNFPTESQKDLLTPQDVGNLAKEILLCATTGRHIVMEKKKMRLEGLEPSTLSLKGRCSTN